MSLFTMFALLFALSVYTLASPVPNAEANPAPIPQVSDINPSNPVYMDKSTFRIQMLNSTNSWRTRYGADACTWDNTLESLAQESADKCNFAHTVRFKISPPDPFQSSWTKWLHGPARD